VVGFIENVHCYKDKENAVAERSQDFYSKVAIGLLVRGRPRRDFEREQTKCQRGQIRQHMPRIREQGKAVCHETGNQLNYEQDTGYVKRENQTVLTGVALL
jgi:hypothetical protein